MERVDIEVPREDREILVTPAMDGLGALVHANAVLTDAYDFVFAGRPVGEYREASRVEITAAAHAYTASLGVPAPAWTGGPVIMTGHQPEFHHPGVWVKNHLTARLAAAVDGIALNLVVDNDVPREGELPLPVRSHGTFTRQHVRFAGVDGRKAYEEHTDKESWRFDRLADEVTALLPIDAAACIVRRFMADVGSAVSAAGDLGHLMTLLRRRYEQTIGMENLEIPASVMCDTQAFALFVLALAVDARRFAETYNAALREYRRVNDIRSDSHPVPDALVDASRAELPFWVWAPGGPRRRLYVTAGDGATFLMDDEPVFTIDAGTWRGMLAREHGSFDAAAGHMLTAGRGKFKIRPRAISNTLFARMFPSDVFIHGVGGAKYDAVTDEIVRRFFGVEPPGFITTSATVFLPIDVEASRREDLRHLRHTLRDVRCNPDRHMDDQQRRAAPAAGLITEKRRLVGRSDELRRRPRAERRSRLRGERRRVFHDIRNCNAELARLIEPQATGLRTELEQVEHHVGDREVVQRRDYPFLLYPEEQLLGFYDEVIRIGGAGFRNSL